MPCPARQRGCDTLSIPQLCRTSCCRASNISERRSCPYQEHKLGMSSKKQISEGSEKMLGGFQFLPVREFTLASQLAEVPGSTHPIWTWGLALGLVPRTCPFSLDLRCRSIACVSQFKALFLSDTSVCTGSLSTFKGLFPGLRTSLVGRQ